MQENTDENNSEYGHFSRSDSHQEVRFAATQNSLCQNFPFRRVSQNQANLKDMPKLTLGAVLVFIRFQYI